MLLLPLAMQSYSDPFERQTPDFKFYYDVKGYERNAWFKEPSALALDERSGLVYVADTGAGTVSAFSLQGIPKFQYGAKNGLKAPIGVAVDRRGDVYVSESAGGPIKVIDSKGEVSTIELPSEEGRDTPKPGRLTIDRDDNLYVVDRANQQVIVFDKNHELKLRFGGLGEERGQFKMLQDVATDRQGRIYALDSLRTPVQVFDRKGGFIYRFGVLGEGERDLSFPVALFVDRNDQIWIVDKSQHSLKVFDRSGMFLRKFGSYGSGEGNLFYPVDAAIDDFGRVYVLESGARRLQVFSLSRPYEPFTPDTF